MAERLFNENFRCPLCNRFHAIRQCTRFMVMPVEEKLRVVAQKALCYNCLAQSHTRGQCKTIDRCRRCLKDHNSWLHPLPRDRVWIKMTARIRIRTKSDKKITWTLALIDPSVTTSSITLLEAEALQCRVKQGRTIITVFYEDDRKNFNVELKVENTTYDRHPSSTIEPVVRSASCDANRYWHKSSEVHVILGADVASRILIGPAKGKPGLIYIQETVFGFAYFGEGTVDTTN